VYEKWLRENEAEDAAPDLKRARLEKRRVLVEQHSAEFYDGRKKGPTGRKKGQNRGCGFQRLALEHGHKHKK